MSTTRFATILPPDGDPHLRVQRVRAGPGGTHLDVHVDDIAAFARRAVAAGAHEQYGYSDVVVLRSPAGLPWCAVGHHGERQRPAPPPAGATGALHLVDQLCIDIPAPRFDEECASWAEVTGWELHQSSLREEFRYLARPQGCPLRLLLQRRDDEAGDARAHVDLASSDIGPVVDHHLRLGATMVTVFEHWTVLADPSGLPYCVTARDPATGRIPQPTEQAWKGSARPKANTSLMEKSCRRPGRRGGARVAAVVAGLMAVQLLSACSVELAPIDPPPDVVPEEPSLVERIDAALDEYERAGGQPSGGAPPIGDGASAYLAALRAVLSSQPDPLYGHDWHAWRGQLLVETHAELTRKARAYAEEDSYFADTPSHLRARTLLWEAADAIDERPE